MARQTAVAARTECLPLLETIVDGLVTIIDDSLVVGALITEYAVGKT